jgi:hypothetical protein
MHELDFSLSEKHFVSRLINNLSSAYDGQVVTISETAVPNVPGILLASLIEEEKRQKNNDPISTAPFNGGKRTAREASRQWHWWRRCLQEQE